MLQDTDPIAEVPPRRTKMVHSLYGHIKTWRGKTCARPLQPAFTLTPCCRVPGIACSAEEGGHAKAHLTSVLADEGTYGGCWSGPLLFSSPKMKKPRTGVWLHLAAQLEEQWALLNEW